MNPFDLMKNLKNIQEKAKELQDKVKDITVTGSAGGGIVQVDLNGKLEVLAVRILPEAVNPEEIEMLQDLIKAAFTDAGNKVKEAMQGEMGDLFPPGMDPGMFS
jgi:DNA-binding YbaB/EbfC family protein